MALWAKAPALPNGPQVLGVVKLNLHAKKKVRGPFGRSLQWGDVFADIHC